MQQGFVDVNGVPTKVITWGKWIEEKFGPDEPKDIIICIPGNPGVTRFYIMFLQTIYEKVGHPIWIMSHAGHELPEQDGNKIPPLKGNEHLYGVEGQIQHKAKFFEKYVPEDARVHLIGHSIGSYLTLQLMKNPTISKKVVKCFCLFPAIEHMAATDNGQWLMTYMPYISNILLYITWMFSILPQFFRKAILWIFLILARVPIVHLESYLSLMHPVVMANFFQFGKEQLLQIFDRDNDVIENNKSKFKFYYGTNDRWCPKSYYNQIIDKHPNVDIEVCSQELDHAFVLRHHLEMASMIISWILRD